MLRSGMLRSGILSGPPMTDCPRHDQLRSVGPDGCNRMACRAVGPTSNPHWFPLSGSLDLPPVNVTFQPDVGIMISFSHPAVLYGQRRLNKPKRKAKMSEFNYEVVVTGDQVGAHLLSCAVFLLLTHCVCCCSYRFTRLLLTQLIESIRAV